MNRQLNPKTIKPDVQNEITKKQQAIIRQYQHPLSQGQNMQKLQNFIASAKPVGSAAYFELPPTLQEIVLKLNLSSIEILIKNEKNPFKKLRFKLAMFATKKMADTGKAKKRLKKERETRLQSVVAARKQKGKNKDLKNLKKNLDKNLNKNLKRKPIKKPIKK